MKPVSFYLYKPEKKGGLHLLLAYEQLATSFIFISDLPILTTP